MLAATLGSRTWLNRVPAGWKLLALALCSVFFFHVTAWWGLAAGLAGVLGLYARPAPAPVNRPSFRPPLSPFPVASAPLTHSVAVAAPAASCLLRTLLHVSALLSSASAQPSPAD